MQILRDRKNLDFIALMCGKLSLDNVRNPIVQKKIARDKIVIPQFMQDMGQYMTALDILA